MFFKIGTSSFPVGSITEIRRDPKGNSGRIFLRDAPPIDASDYELRRLTDLYPIQVIPAAPGTAQLVFDEDAKTPADHTLWPIIGWAVHADGTVSTVTATEVEEDVNFRLILHPSGIVESPHDTVYQDIEAAFVGLQNRQGISS